MLFAVFLTYALGIVYFYVYMHVLLCEFMKIEYVYFYNFLDFCIGVWYIDVMHIQIILNNTNNCACK